MKLHTTLTARDIMTAEPVCAEPSTTIRQLARLFENNEISGCPVVNQEGRLVGVVSKSDLIRRCSEGTAEIPPAYLFEVVCEHDGVDADSGSDRGTPPIPEPLICVQDFMTETAVTVRANTPVHEIASLMVAKHIHRVVVVDEEEFPVGTITTLDVLKVFPPPRSVA
jgi:CBS domain-containing protein